MQENTNVSMNRNGVWFRPYKDEDFDELVQSVAKAWHYEEMTDKKTAVKLARVFLSSCLTNYTYSKVAIYKGKKAGIILVNHYKKHKVRLKDRFVQAKAITSLLLSKEGRRVMKTFGSVQDIDKVMISQNGFEYPAEIALFMVNPNFHGLGIGKQLFDFAEEYLKQEKAERYFLYTDTSCSYGFYDHRKLTRRCESYKTLQLKNQTADMGFFIYDNEVPSL